MPYFVNKLDTLLTGKILSYLFNAVDDAAVSEELVYYIKHQQFSGSHSIPEQRAKVFIGENPNASDDFLIGLAYAIYGVNGWVNWMYASLMQKLLLSSEKASIKAFITDYVERFSVLLLQKSISHFYPAKPTWKVVRPWRKLLFGDISLAQSFAKEKLNYTQPLQKKEIIKACLVVQKTNSNHNLNVGADLLTGKPSQDNKVLLLAEAAKAFKHTQAFLQSAANTQKAAANWDKICIFTLSSVHLR